MAQHRSSWCRPSGPLPGTAVTLAGAALLVGCGAGSTDAGTTSTASSSDQVSCGSSVSRARLYASLDELVADSPVIVAGTAGAQEVAADITPGLDFTLTSFRVGASIAPAGDPVEGSIVVRQTGVAECPPAPLMIEEDAYLLFLTPSGLDGERASHYYVTGVTAGLYAARDAGAPQDRAGWRSAVFEEFAPAQGDVLPDILTEADLSR